jgi:hypothetical protein
LLKPFPNRTSTFQRIRLSHLTLAVQVFHLFRDVAHGCSMIRPSASRI